MKSIVHNKDCMLDLPNYQDNEFDYAIVDTNWGIKETSINPESRNTPVIQKNGKAMKIGSKNYSNANWDDVRPNEEYFKQLFRISKYQVIKGGNHLLDLFPESSSGRIVWDKVNGSSHFSDGEIFWTNIFSSVRIFSYMWHGMMQGISLLEPRTVQGNKKLYETRIHRNQTPVKVYDWIYGNYIPKGSKIIDTHLGSGSNRVSAYKNECDFVAYEIGEKEFLDQEKRFASEQPLLNQQLKMINQISNQQYTQGVLL